MKLHRYNNFSYLNESMTDITYHGTYVKRLENILKTDTLNLTPTLGNRSDNYKNIDKDYFFSTQRTKGLTGYISKSGVNVILELDRRKLNHNFKSVPVDYFDGLLDIPEHEDRLVGNKDEISNFSKYILSIHILYNDKYNYSTIIKLTDKLGIPLYIYTNERDSHPCRRRYYY